MPKFSIRFYHQYVDEWHVEAKDLAEATVLADTYTKDTPAITRIAEREYVDYDIGYGCAIKADGSYDESEEI